MASRTDSVRHFPPDGRIIGLGLALIAVMFLTISPLALVNLGFNYDDTGGNVFEKVHPATQAAIVVLVLAACFQRNPLTALMTALETYPGTSLFLVAIAFMIATPFKSSACRLRRSSIPFWRRCWSSSCSRICAKGARCASSGSSTR